MDRDPIWFFWTRSFWLGLLPAVMLAFDLVAQGFEDPNTATPFAWALASLAGGVLALWNLLPLLPDIAWRPTPEWVLHTMKMLAPLYAMVVGWQRRGAARPYTLDPRARQ